MKSEIKSISPVCVEAVVVVEQSIVKDKEDSVLNSFAKDMKIPGFRKGKVPVTLIKSRYAKELSEQVDKTIADQAFSDLIKENNFDVFSLSKFDIRTLENGDREIKFTIDLKPSFELLDYKNIEIENPDIEVSDKEVDDGIQQILSRHADYKVVERAAQKGDFVRLQYVGKFEDGTPVIDTLKHAPIWAEQKNTWEEAGSEDAPGVRAIIDGIVGMSANEEKDVTMDFAADFEITELQGKKVNYHIKVFEVREKILPELNDEFLEKLKEKDLASFREHVKNDIANRKMQVQRFEQREAVVQKMIDMMNFEIPQSAIDYEQVHIMRSFIERQIHEGMTAEMIQANKDKLYEDTKELSRDRAKINFILEKIAEQEAIKLTDKELNQMVFQEAMMLRTSPDRLIKELKGNRERILELQRRALFGKTLDFVLVENLKRFPNYVDTTANQEENNSPAEETESSDASK